MAKLSDFVERLKDEIKSEYGDKKYKEWLSDIENSGGVTAGEEQKMFVAYVKSHPEKLKLNAYSTYKNVMLLAFPVESE
ncbi:TPA: hypothetical protein JBJ57_14155 [Legionella pneumophila]|nr:hypothetical protein [Legionella pneumophila]